MSTRYFQQSLGKDGDILDLDYLILLNVMNSQRKAVNMLTVSFCIFCLFMVLAIVRAMKPYPGMSTKHFRQTIGEEEFGEWDYIYMLDLMDMDNESE